MPRRTHFSRKAAGELTEQQVVAANIDVVFLVMGLDRDYNPRRLERYLLLARESGATPHVLLSKADLCDDLTAPLAEIGALAPGVALDAVSVRDGRGLDAVRPAIGPGQTGALLGSSGAGKSTLINALLGQDRLATKAVRASDSRGRHTTRHRQLVPLPGGGLLIDTPGMRELQLWAAAETADPAATSFEDIDALAAGCHFTNCRHLSEPRCAVREAVAEGTPRPGAPRELPQAAGRSAVAGRAAGRARAHPGARAVEDGRPVAAPDVPRRAIAAEGVVAVVPARRGHPSSSSRTASPARRAAVVSQCRPWWCWRVRCGGRGRSAPLGTHLGVIEQLHDVLQLVARASPRRRGRQGRGAARRAPGGLRGSPPSRSATPTGRNAVERRVEVDEHVAAGRCARPGRGTSPSVRRRGRASRRLAHSGGEGSTAGRWPSRARSAGGRAPSRRRRTVARVNGRSIAVPPPPDHPPGARHDVERAVLLRLDGAAGAGFCRRGNWWGRASGRRARATIRRGGRRCGPRFDSAQGTGRPCRSHCWGSRWPRPSPRRRPPAPSRAPSRRRPRHRRSAPRSRSTRCAASRPWSRPRSARS